MNARVLNALGLIRKEAATPGQRDMDSWRNQLSKLPLIGKYYDAGVPEDMNGGFPTREEKLRFLQNQRDSGSPRWHTAEGMNSQARFAGNDDGMRRGGFNREERLFGLNFAEKHQKRRDALNAMISGFPEYRPSEMASALSKANKGVKIGQQIYDAQREREADEGRKLFFDQGGRWAPTIPKMPPRSVLEK
jgi:hypothetical protein